jgi:hypothetical protein
MSGVDALPRSGLGQTMRRDLWWVQPLLVFLGFSTFIVYSTWRAFEAAHFEAGPYLSPFFSPLLFDVHTDPALVSRHAWFGGRPEWWPGILVYSPAMLILWAPGGFRFTCYYYRGAYYKAFWADPLNCTVGEPRHKYLGENSLPLILQNVHRWFLYLALIFIVILSWDVYLATRFEVSPGSRETEFGIGLGTLIMAVNVVLIASYTFGCHSLRHLIGGKHDCLSGAPAKLRAYKFVGCMNRRHMMWAWFSIFSVGFTDLYVRMCATGVWHDWRIL